MPPDFDDFDQGAGELDQATIDQHAALDAIGNEAALTELDQEQKQQQATEAPNPMAGAQGWAMLAQGIGSMLAIGMPEIAPAYNEQTCMAWGASMDALSQKYGWGDGVSRFGPEIAVVMTSVPLVMPVVCVVKARKAAAAEAEKGAVRPLVNGAEPMREGAPVEVLP